MESKSKGKIGKKAENLAELKENSFNVPDFSVVTDKYFDENIFPEISGNEKFNLSDWNSIFFNEDAGNQDEKIRFIKSAVENHKIREDFKKELGSVIKKGEYYAVRSSSVEEDGDDFSFAGQFETFLYITEEEIIEKIRKVWLSSFSPHIMRYRLEKKINNKINVPAVIIQKMVNSEKSGVAFSVNPVSRNENEIVIAATLGLGTSIVDGDENGDLYTVDKNLETVSKEIKTKTVRQILDYKNKRIKTEYINEKNEVLDGEELKKLAQKISEIEKKYGKPQDIEWAYEGGNLYILQTRPITTLSGTGRNAQDDVNVIIWDNSNIVESYPEITLPFTFSFIKKAYSSVYRQFSGVMGISHKMMESYAEVYDNMLGLLNGRVYYNLINWYKLLLLFPNSKSNSKFMEQMMGVKKELPDVNLEENISEAYGNMNFWEKKASEFKKAKAGLSIFLNMFFIEKKAEKFYELIKENINDNKYDISKMDIVQLRKYYKSLESRFLKKWEVPIINDFLVMIWFGISRRITEKYIPENADEVHNILVAQKGENMVSVEPSKYMEKLGKLVKEDKSLQEEIKNIIKDENTAAEIGRITENSEFNQVFAEYLEKFGDRTVHELKLESVTLRENPVFLLKMIYSLSMKREAERHSARDITAEQEKIYAGLKISRIKKVILKKSIAYAQKFIKIRENLRYERTKVYGITRKVVKQFGAHLKRQNLIEDSRDVFYMTVDELFGLLDASAIDTDIGEVIRIRKKQYEKYRSMPALPDRFLTKGFAGGDFYYEDLSAAEGGSQTSDSENRNELRGTACSKGIVKGKVKVVLNPMETEIEEGDIVVTKSTDPSWVMVFPLLRGLIVEKGSLLSHSAIISREMNIPAIVGVQGVTEKLKTGDLVQFDGSTGIIRKMEEEGS